MNKEIIKKISNEILSSKIMLIEDLLNHSFSKIAITTGELIFRTSQKSIKYAKGCVATTKKNDPKNGRWTFSVKCNQNWSKGPYDVRFKLIKNKGIKTKGILGREINLSCNCNAWKYNGADYNALHNDYSERQYSNGQNPSKRDPQKRYLICKHIAACVPLFKRFIIPKEIDIQPIKTPIKQPITKTPVKQPIVKTPIKQPIKSPIKQPIKTPIKQPIPKTLVKQPIIKSPVRPVK
jgi:hypothetical protein